MDETTPRPTIAPTSRPAIVSITSLDDPRTAAYRNLKDRELAAMNGELFIVEGELLVRRLLASAYSIESILVSEHRAESMLPIIGDRVPVYLAPRELVHQILGYQFHSGVIAVARRGKSPTLDEILGPIDSPRTLMICPEIANTDNLGALIRIAAAFGLDALLLGERSCDPFFRHAVRVSMGTVFSLPIVRSKDLLTDLQRLRERKVELIASVLHASAEPLAGAPRAVRTAILFGSEAQGLSREEIDACDRTLCIPMLRGTDSLNVAAAAGIFCYHFTQIAKLKISSGEIEMR